MKKLLALIILALTLAASNGFATTPVAQPDAADVVRNFYSQLQDTMKQGEKLGFSARFKKLEPVIKASFDLARMTKIAVGSTWSIATDAEQKQLITAFSDFSIANYANQFKTSDGEVFSVIGSAPAAIGTIVQTKLKPKEGDAVELNYLVQQDDKGAWHIVDVFLNGSISELAARRSEFSSIAKRDGIPALVNSLGEKSKAMGPS